MATQGSPSINHSAAAPNNLQAGTSPPVWAGEMRYVARQPILNLRGHVHGYELIFRNPPEALETQDDDVAARTMLDNAVIFGLEGLTNGSTAFVSCTIESLTEDLTLFLAPETTVLAIPASLDLTPRLIDCCRQLKSRGFRLALDDFTWNPALRPLAEIADYIRIDFDGFGSLQHEYLNSLAAPTPVMVANRVETQADYQRAREDGFKLFKGSYFCNPTLLKKRKLPANRMLHFEIVRLLHNDPIDIPLMSKLVQRDAALTYRLLRLVNSPIYAIRQQVRSAAQAIIAIGENALRRIISLAVLTELNDEGPPEILHMALLRARFCEKTARLCGQDPSEQYLLGMLSLLPSMLRIPMEELTPTLPLRADVCEALLGTRNAERSMLTWMECHERGDWESCDEIAQTYCLRPTELMQQYAASAVWAAASLHSAT
jgi:EAL and modified HD-GYP domain-containing signal transduction protein